MHSCSQVVWDTSFRLASTASPRRWMHGGLVLSHLPDVNGRCWPKKPDLIAPLRCAGPPATGPPSFGNPA